MFAVFLAGDTGDTGVGITGAVVEGTVVVLACGFLLIAS
jgi:hypothetical protein